MTFPEPPWTQAPSEVMAWGSSVGGRIPAVPRAHRPSRVKGYEVHVSASEEGRILGRMSRLGLGELERGHVHLPRLVTRLAHHAPANAFLGRMSGVRIEVLLRKRSRLEVRMRFTPATTFRKAWRIVLRLGLHPAEGAWL